MKMEIIQSGDGSKAGGRDNIVRFSRHVTRRSRKILYKENNLARLAGCDVIHLADRRN